MPVDYTLSDRDRLVLAVGIGLLTAEDILQFHERLRTDSAVRPGMGMLFDASLADPTTNFAELRAAAADFRKIAEGGVDRVAIVAPEGLVLGLAHVYSLFADAEGFKVKVFAGAEEARAWLNPD